MNRQKRQAAVTGGASIASILPSLADTDAVAADATLPAALRAATEKLSALAIQTEQ